MYKKLRTLQTIDESGAVLIVRLDNADVAERVAEAAIAGGFRALEITLSIPGAVEVIRRLSAKHGPNGVAIGAGTVLDEHSAYECIRAGAEFLVSPQLNPAMIRTANRYQIPTISGAYTPTELVNSAEAGADILKLFPTEAGGIPYAKSVLAPLAHLPIMPAGGVTAAECGRMVRRRRSRRRRRQLRDKSMAARRRLLPASPKPPRISSQQWQRPADDSPPSLHCHRPGRIRENDHRPDKQQKNTTRHTWTRTGYAAACRVRAEGNGT